MDCFCGPKAEGSHNDYVIENADRSTPSHKDKHDQGSQTQYPEKHTTPSMQVMGGKARPSYKD